MKNFIYIFILFITFYVNAQNNLSELLKELNTESVSYIYVNELDEILKQFQQASEGIDEVILLDAREEKEYNISHLKNAQFVGYDRFHLKKTIKKLPDKNAEIIVYCSLGVRSEDIAEKLQKAGYTNVRNLYGGIFEWKNNGYKVFDSEEKETEKVHAFDKDWGIWLTKGEKIYE